MNRMYKWSVTAALCFCVTLMVAQAPQKFNYQGVARNSAGDPIVSSPIGLRLSITDGSTSLYTETFTITTNALGLFTAEIGGGNIVSGSFAAIDWSTGARYLKVEMDPAGGVAYTDMGSSQLLSVPYALFANRTGTLNLGDLGNVSSTAPVTNQVLQWNGTEWVPANISSGGGDNWGSQTVTTNTTLTGNGTSASPLGMGQQGATNGQVLKWNGTAWAPANDGGDNWGTQNVVTNSSLTGNGTSANPLGIGQQGATSGQVLKWNGTAWAPANDNNSGFTLPYTASVSDAGYLFNLINTGTGYGIRAAVNGAGTAALTGFHSGTGIGILGQNTGGGLAGAFISNSNSTTPNVRITEDANDFARLMFMNSNSATRNWQLAGMIDASNSSNEYFNLYHHSAGNVIIARGDGNVGIGMVPTQRLDVAGNLQFSGALMPGSNAGTSGQILRSNGTGVAPTWTSPTEADYNNTYLYEGGNASVTVTTTPTVIPNLGPLSFTTNGTSKVIINAGAGVFNQYNVGGGDARVYLTVELLNSSSTLIKSSSFWQSVNNDAYEVIFGQMLVNNLAAGTYTVNVKINLLGSWATDVIVMGPPESKTCSIQVIPQ